MVNNGILIGCSCHYKIGEQRVEGEAKGLIQHGYQVNVIYLQNDQEKPFEKLSEVDIFNLAIQRHRGRGPVFSND